MTKEIVVYSPEIPSGMSSKNLWNDDSVHILLTEYKKLKDNYLIRRSSSMPKKGWELIKRKLHSAGYTDIRHQHVIKKFAALKLHYKELREGLPVKQRVYGFVDLLSEILDNDPYIAFAKPTKRMKEKRLFEKKKQNTTEPPDNYITLEFTNLQSDEMVSDMTGIMDTRETENIETGQYIDASILLNENVDDNQQIDVNLKKQKKMIKAKKELAHVDNDKPGMPSWISYLVELLRKEEQQRTNHLWRLHEDICQAEKVKVDMLERLISCLTNTSTSEVVVEKPDMDRTVTELVLPDSQIVVPDKVTPKNIIIVDEEGSIYLKPSELLKMKGDCMEYALTHKIFKPQPEVEFLEADSIIEAPQLQLQLIGEGDEIIIENCEDSEIYKVEPVYEEELEESDVISHVEIVEEQVEEEGLVEHHIDAIEFIQPVPHDQ